MTFSLEVPKNLNGRLVSGPVDQLTDEALDAFGEASVNALKASDSLWPVRTGKSKRAFRWRRRGKEVAIENPVVYAGAVEDRDQPAANTLTAAEQRIEREVEDVLSRTAGRL